jgi:hypothetical protein
MPAGLSPTGIVEVAKARDFVGVVIVKGTALDVPPPGAGLETVTEAMRAEARSDLGTTASSW